MRRADRLFQIVQLLRGRRVVTAAELAEELEVSPRTIYRDVADLIGSGVPIEGEAGVGYCLPRGFDLPPLMFDDDEIGALVLGMRMVEAWGSRTLAARARSVLAKVETVLPDRLRPRLDAVAMVVPPDLPADVRDRVELFRRAVDARRLLRFAYEDRHGAHSTRTVRPLVLAFWGTTWTASAWCELREDFRHFVPQRMTDVELLDETFEHEPGRDRKALFERIAREEAAG